MNKTKRFGDRELPGNPLLWIFGSLVAVCVLLAVVGAFFASMPDTRDGYVQPQEEKEAITPDRQQVAVRAMADFMVKDDNVIGLRMWARSLGISAPDFASAATIRENIRRNTNDFEIYRDQKELTRLVELLGNQDAILDEVIR
jgi:hypothetical protein